MATEKRLNTRILLRYDEYTNWYNKNPKLLKGEVAIATIPENHTDPSTGKITQIPAVVMKVGTGADTGSNYRDLPFLSAKAADVLAACKTEDGLTAFVNNVIANAGIATDEAMGKLAERVTKLEGDENTAGSVAKAIKDAIDALDLANTYVAQEDGKSLMTDVERTKLTGISEGANKVEASSINGKIKIDGVDTTVYAHPDKHAIADVDGLQTALNGLQEKGDYAAEEHTHTASDVTDFATEVAKIKVSNAAKADEATKATQDGNGKVIADTYAEKATTLAGYKIGDAYTKDEVNNLIQGAKDHADNNDANTEYHVEYDSTSKKIKLVAGADASKMEIPTDDFIKDGMIQSVAISEDGKNLVITWNTDAGKEATNIALTELVDVMTGVDGTTITVNVSADDKISAEVKAGSITTSHIAANAGIVKTQLHADVQASLDLADSAEQNAKDYTDDQIEELGLGTMSKETASDYVKKSDAIGYDDILTATTASSLYVTQQAHNIIHNAIDEKLATIQDKDTDKSMRTVAQEEVASAAGNYATAEQGDLAESAVQSINSSNTKQIIVSSKDNVYAIGLAPDAMTSLGKADTAIQSVTSVAGNGIKATTTDNAVTIDWDTDVVFVFDCGNADA